MSAKVIKAWAAKAAKRALALESVNLESLGLRMLRSRSSAADCVSLISPSFRHGRNPVSSTMRYRASRDLSRRFTEVFKIKILVALVLAPQNYK